jgi:hypothetical protein
MSPGACKKINWLPTNGQHSFTHSAHSPLLAVARCTKRQVESATCSRSAVERCVETLLATKTSSAEWRASHVENFVLDYLPPYSPELNRIERVWKLTRRQCLHNRYFPVLEEVVAVVETLFGNWRNGNETLRRFCAQSNDTGLTAGRVD